MTPTEVAVRIYGEKENHSRSRGARHVRVIARRLFPSSAPGQGREWKLSAGQVRLIQREITRA